MTLTRAESLNDSPLLVRRPRRSRHRLLPVPRSDDRIDNRSARDSQPEARPVPTAGAAAGRLT